MDFLPCENCGKQTGHKRAFGIGTIIAFFCTLGLWVLAMPFYPARCIVCGMGSGKYPSSVSGKYPSWIKDIEAIHNAKSEDTNSDGERK